MKTQVLEDNQTPPLVVLFNKRPDRQGIHLLKYRFSEILISLIAIAVFLVLVGVIPEYSWIWAGGSAIYLAAKLILTRFYSQEIVLGKYSVSIRRTWENELSSVTRAILLNVVVTGFIAGVFDYLGQSITQMPDTLWLEVISKSERRTRE